MRTNSECRYPDCLNCILEDCTTTLSYKAMKQREYNLRNPQKVRESSKKYYELNKNTEKYKRRNRENQAKYRRKKQNENIHKSD